MNAAEPAAAAGVAGASAVSGRRAALTVLLLASTLTVMAGAVISPILALIRDDLGLSDTQAGLILTVHGFTLAVASPLAGRAIDRWGARGPLVAGLVVYGIAGGAGTLTDGYAALIASRLVFGVGTAAVFTAATVAIFELYRGPARRRAMGWRSSAISAGGLVWPLAAGMLGALSWHAPFAVYLLGLPLAAAALVTLPGGPAAPTGSPAPASSRRGELLALLRRRPALLGCYGLQLVTAFLLYTMLVFIPLRLADVGVDGPLAAATCTGLLSGAMAAVGLAYAPLRSRVHDIALVRAALAVWAAAFLVAACSDHPAALGVAAALFGVGMGVAVPALTVLVAEAAPPNLLGRATSLSATATFLSQPISPLLFGPLVAATSIPTGFLAAGAVAATAAATLPALGLAVTR